MLETSITFTAMSVSGSKRSRDDKQPGMTRVKRVKSNTSANSTFRFLDLPAELRNRIYEMQIGELIKNGVVELAHVPGGKSTDATSKRESTKSETFNVFALSQVSQQVRAEFLPLFMSNVAVRVHNRNAMRYFATFFPLSETSCKASVAIHVGYAGDFLPSLSFCLDEPSIVCNFTGLYPKQQAMLNKTWKYRSAWKQAIKDDFCAIEACHASDDLLLTMRGTSQQAWKEQMSVSKNFRAPPLVMNPFFERLGWSDSEELPNLR